MTSMLSSLKVDAEKKRVDQIIAKLCKVRDGYHSTTPYVNLTEEEITFVCKTVYEVLLERPVLLELQPPIKILGDIHGQYLDLLHWFNCAGTPQDNQFLFLGDYVDRGKQSIETMLLLFAFKIRYPENLHLLRGNHESASLNKVYGFFDECKRRYSVKIWKTFVDCFNCLPVAAVIDDKIFCCHGGLSPHLNKVEDVKHIRRPTDVPESGLLCDLLWADPEGDGFLGFKPNDRGVSYVFGSDVVEEFLLRNDLDLVCRAHQVVEDGYEFFANQALVTIFSAPNYCGEFRNAGALLAVNAHLVCSFMTVQPFRAESYKKRIRDTLFDFNDGKTEKWVNDDSMDIDL